MDAKTAAKLEKSAMVNGFRVLRIEDVPEIRIRGYELVHERTGARILHLHCEDPENLFSIGFRTPPPDSSGVAHILEHSVLAGSDKYPVKDAFNELAKGSLQTFINAFTYPDKTVYPVTSQVRVDYFNLAEVYSDLVFRPRLLRETFCQEGHHLEFADPGNIESELVESGIVYNEMKGSYSSPDSLMNKSIQENLYPDTVYRFDSGGDPEKIPQLTYEGLKAFHRSYYSASNARFFIYGNIPTRDHLSFLGKILSDMDRIDVDSRIPKQRRWTERPMPFRSFYPVSRGEGSKNKTAVNIAWMVMDHAEVDESLIFQVLVEALVGNAAGPLRKALIDSGLGEDLSPVTGLEKDLRQMAFVVGLRGTDPEKAGQIEALVNDTLSRVSRDGLDRELIEAAFHQIEFRAKEMVRSYYPYSIVLLQRVYRTWLYDGDAFQNLRYASAIEMLRERGLREPDMFCRAITKWLVENPHRITTVLEPSPTLASEKEENFRSTMAALKASLPPAELHRIRDESMLLKKIQSEHDSPEALAALPRIGISELPREIDVIPTEETKIAGSDSLVHELFANGIAYLDLAFDISDVPDEQQPCLPLLGKLMIGMGAAGRRYDEVSKRIALFTGGIAVNLAAGFLADGSGAWQKFIVRVKCLHRNIPEALALLSDLLVRAEFSDTERMRDILLESRNRLRSAIIPSGHMFAKRTAAAALNLVTRRDEQWHGRMQLQFRNELARRIDSGKKDLIEEIVQLRDHLIRKGRVTLNLTADENGLKLLIENAAGLMNDLPSGGVGGASAKSLEECGWKGIIIPAHVCYVARVFPAPPIKSEFSSGLMVLSRYLSSDYMYKKIRVMGGAYGGMSIYDPFGRTLSFLSYRDPNLIQTLDVYEEALGFIEKTSIPDEALRKAVIGTIGALDRPMDPPTKGLTALTRSFSELADADRQHFRNAVLDVSPEGIRQSVTRHIDSLRNCSAVCVYADHDRLQKAKMELGRKFRIESLD